MSSPAIQISMFQDPVSRLIDAKESVKATKEWLREQENDFPMELEDLMIQQRDLNKQVKEGKDAHKKKLIEENSDYNDMRAKLQEVKEEEAKAKLDLEVLAVNMTREHGDIDDDIRVDGAPFRLQTQKEVHIYLNGKAVK